jgi:hypothetical protein
MNKKIQLKNPTLKYKIKKNKKQILKKPKKSLKKSWA